MEDEYSKMEIAKIVKLKDSSNYPMWKFQIDIMFKSSGLYEIVTGEELKQESMSAAQKKDYNRRDAKAMKYIITSCEHSVLVHIMTCLDSKTMYSKLKSSFEKDSGQMKITLLNSFYTFKINNTDNIQQQISALEFIAHRIKGLGEDISETMIISKVISALPEEYAHFHSAWESTAESERSLSNLMARLADEQRMNGGKSKEVENRNQQAAFKVSSYPGRSSGPPGRTSGQVRCYSCGKMGHKAPACRSKPEKKFCSICKKGNHTESSCYFRDKPTYFCQSESYALVSTDHNSFNNSRFAIDSGSSSHLVNNVSLLSNTEDCEETYKAANGERLQSTKIGKYEGKDVRLDEVRYIPGLATNLLSVNCITKNKGKVIFNNNVVKIVDEKNTTVIEGKKAPNGLYIVDLPQPIDKNVFSMELVHRKLGHLGNTNMTRLKTMVDGVDFKGTISDCDVCTRAKQKRNPFSGTLPTANRILEIVDTDLMGPLDPPTFDGYKYIQVIMDVYTRYVETHLLKSKTEASDTLIKFILRAENLHQTKAVCVKMDNGLEFSDAKKWLENRGTKVDTTAPYSPPTNGRCEQKNYTISCRMRALLYDSGLSKQFWGFAARTAAYLINRSPTVSLDKTPIEMWTGRKPDLRKLKLFGCRAYAKTLTHVKKLDERSKEMIFVGYGQNGYLLYDKDRNKVITARDVIFFENEENKIKMPDNLDKNDNFCFEEVEIDILPEENKEENSSSPENEEREEPANTSHEISGINDEEIEPDRGAETGYSLRQQLRPPQRYDQYELDLSSIFNESTSMLCYSEAVKDARWRQAILSEKESLLENKTWIYVDRKEAKGEKVMSCKWIFKIKEDGRYKARMVCRGFEQDPDDEDYYSPVVETDTVRTVFAIAAGKKFKIITFDVTTAFLAGEFKPNEKIFIEIPEGFKNDKNKNKICRVLRGLYGIRGSPKRWNEKFTETLKKLGFKQLDNDPCTFINKNGTIIITCYVDDGAIFYSNESEVKDFLNNLKAEFKITINYNPMNYAGLEIKQEENKIIIHQKNYCQQIVSKYNMQDANGCDIPISIDNEEDSSPRAKNFPYREAVGSLLYLTTKTRPDAAFAVNYESRNLENPTELNVRNVKQTIKYLLKNPNLGLAYNIGGQLDELIVYSDADFAGCQTTSRSTTGYVIFYNGPIAWCSKRQSIVTLSSTESELVAATEATKHAVALKRLIEEVMDIKLKQITLRIDNQSTIKLIKNGNFRKRTRHISVRYHYLMELYKKGELNVEHCSSNDQKADFLTKPLNRILYKEHCKNTLQTVL